MTESMRTSALITGANRGIGAETARRLAELGWTVWIGARSIGAAAAACDAIRASSPGADLRAVQLDVTSDESVDAAYGVVAASGTGLDVLVNNAGVADPATNDTLGTRAEDLLPTYAVNVLGPVRVTRAFLPLLQRSAHPRLVMVSSGMGSIERISDPAFGESRVPGFVYASSKAALDLITVQYAKALPAFRVRAVDPGYTDTEMNGNRGTQTVAEGTDAIIAAASAAQVPAGKFDRSDLEA